MSLQNQDLLRNNLNFVIENSKKKEEQEVTEEEDHLKFFSQQERNKKRKKKQKNIYYQLMKKRIHLNFLTNKIKKRKHKIPLIFKKLTNGSRRNYP